MFALFRFLLILLFVIFLLRLWYMILDVIGFSVYIYIYIYIYERWFISLLILSLLILLSLRVYWPLFVIDILIVIPDMQGIAFSFDCYYYFWTCEDVSFFVDIHVLVIIVDIYIKRVGSFLIILFLIHWRLSFS